MPDPDRRIEWWGEWRLAVQPKCEISTGIACPDHACNKGVRGIPDVADRKGIRKVDYGWVVVAVAFWVIAITSGSFYSYGVFFKPMLAEFGWNRQLTAGVMGLACLIYVVVLPIVGHMADRYGPRWVMAVSTGLLGAGYLLAAHVQSALHLYLFVGVVGGLSYPALLPVPVAVVSRWFQQRRGLALGIALSGVGVGTLALPPLIALIVSAYGWRTGFLALGVLVSLSCIPPSVLLMQDPDGQGSSSSQEIAPSCRNTATPGERVQSFSILEALRTQAFWLLFFLYGSGIVVVGMMMIHIVPHLTDLGISATLAASVLGGIGIGSVAGRVLAGILTDRYGTKNVLLACLSIQGIVLLALTRAGSFLVSYGLALSYGISYGGFMVLIPALTSRFFGLRAMGAIFATLSISEGIGFGLGSFLAGYLWDMTGSYSVSFLGGMMLVLLCMVLAALLREPADGSRRRRDDRIPCVPEDS